MADEVKPYTPDQMRFGEFSLVFFGVSAEGPIQPDSVYAKRIASLLATARAGLVDRTPGQLAVIVKREVMPYFGGDDWHRLQRVVEQLQAEDAARGVHPEGAAKCDRGHGVGEGALAKCACASVAGTSPETTTDARLAEIAKRVRDEGVAMAYPDVAADIAWMLKQLRERSERPQDVSRVHTPAPTKEGDSD